MSRYGPVVPTQNERPGRYCSESRISNRKIKNPAVRVLKVNWYETGLYNMCCTLCARTLAVISGLLAAILALATTLAHCALLR